MIKNSIKPTTLDRIPSIFRMSTGPGPLRMHIRSGVPVVIISLIVISLPTVSFLVFIPYIKRSLLLINRHRAIVLIAVVVALGFLLFEKVI